MLCYFVAGDVNYCGLEGKGFLVMPGEGELGALRDDEVVWKG